MYQYPEKLLPGDQIRVLSPSNSMKSVGGMENNLIAKKRLEALGYSVTFSRNIAESDLLSSASITSRVEDLHEAFSDPKVKGILTTIGGSNSIELLPYLDYQLIQQNPKILCGYSDTTALQNALLAKAKLVTYSGPCYSAFKMDELQDYQSTAWQFALTQKQYKLQPSDFWTSDPWFLPEIPRNLQPNEWKVYTEGSASGTAVIGNLSTFGLLQGTDYMPKPEKPVLFIENAEEDDYLNFNRDLASILQIFPEPQAVLIGRFPHESKMTEEMLLYILAKYPILKKVPVIYEMNFGHTQPIFTFPIGGFITVNTLEKKVLVDETVTCS